MPHMVAAEHIGLINALQYGSTRNDATLAAAIAAIGSQVRRLLLAFDGDGIWTFNSAWTIPANVILEIPPGVKVSGSGVGTITGGVITYDGGWYLGTNPLSYGNAPIFFTNAMASVALALGRTHLPGYMLHLYGDAGRPAAAVIEEGWDATNGPYGGGAVLSFRAQGGNRASLGLEPGATSQLRFNLQAGVDLRINGGHVGINMSPSSSQELKLSTGAAQKATGTLWTNPSDQRLKTVQRPFEDGLNVIMNTQPYWLKFNGLGGTNPDIPEFVAILAQELRPHAPYMIGEYAALLHPGDAEPTTLYNYDGSAMTFALVNAIKEQQTIIAQLQTRLEALEALTGDRADGLEAVAHTHTGQGSASGAVPYTPGARQAHQTGAARKRK